MGPISLVKFCISEVRIFERINKNDNLLIQFCIEEDPQML